MELILYLGTFILAYLFYFVFVLSRNSVLKKFPDGKEMSYLKYKYGIKINDKNLKKVAHTVCLANSFILATTVYVVCLFDSLVLEVLIGIVTLIILILVIYHLIGTYYKKKQGGKHV
jgi:hypothetical protein